SKRYTRESRTPPAVTQYKNIVLGFGRFTSSNVSSFATSHVEEIIIEWRVRTSCAFMRSESQKQTRGTLICQSIIERLCEWTSGNTKRLTTQINLFWYPDEQPWLVRTTCASDVPACIVPFMSPNSTAWPHQPLHSGERRLYMLKPGLTDSVIRSQ
ncbi:469_t:CDS:2, partial [Ambispora gerdemannii]